MEADGGAALDDGDDNSYIGGSFVIVPYFHAT